MVTALAAAGAVAVLSGCGWSEDREAAQVASQEAQLKVLMSTADGRGAEIMGQIPASEVGTTVDTSSIALTSDFYEEWPKYYVWSQTVELHLDGPRTPAQVADDLEPWLAQHGWMREEENEFPPGRESFTRYYRWGGFRLAVEAFTDLPPRAQTLRFAIITPDTDPDAPSPAPTTGSGES
ncbi:MAG: hypothetical protein ACTHMF_04445 [Leifsonia sp.]|uniref:hypothetical protein n=1 Tax=Leifsonia sp. TaxID=1870902 RepID=UPI003F7E396D